MFKGRLTRSNFRSQLLLKLEEVNEANQNFYHWYQLKQYHKNNWTKNGSCEPYKIGMLNLSKDC